MAIVYVTPEAVELAANFGIGKRLEVLCEKLRAEDFDSALRLLDIRHPYYYERLDNYRVVFHVRIEMEQRVLCALHVYKRGDKAIEHFFTDRAAVGRKLEDTLDSVALRNYVEEQIQALKLKETRAAKETLPDEVRAWMDPFDQARELDLIVMESPEWVDAMRQKENSNYWQSYHALVERVIFGDGAGEAVAGQEAAGGSDIRCMDGVDKRAIFYAQFEVQSGTEGLDTTQVLFLLGLSKDDAARSELQIKAPQIHGWIPRKGARPIRDDVARRAARAYPAVLVADSDMWLKVQQDDHANLALSGEEAGLLSVARQTPQGGAEPALPVFINGRAGSGKSTLLYHLFSDYVNRAASVGSARVGDMLFLTYSEKLLSKARDTVGRLLKNRYEFLDRRSERHVPASERQLTTSFQPFSRFVLTLVPDEERSRYASERHIDLRRFKQLFSNSSDLPESLSGKGLRIPIPKGVTAELSWHVIRTFIKGYSVTQYLTEDAYEDVPPKERSVSADLFGVVYRTVWDKWYRKLVEEEGFWDSQDLVRHVLRADAAQPKYAVMFCDEAQDFTRLEINFILRLLIYRKYDLGWERRIRLPFVLAGDPFQTLSPTGFRWESVKADFYNEVRRELDPENRQTVAFRYEPLLFNYRSSDPVVKLGNLITLVQQRLSARDREARPQQSWRDDAPGMAALLVLDGTESPDDLTGLFRDSVIIVPCEPGEEADFARQDAYLERHTGQGQGVTLLSPMSAKGLEFSQVILYGFGSRCPDSLTENEPSGEEASRLEAEYFLNKLYVGCTRATRDVIIVDTPDGNARLWSRLSDKDFRRIWTSDAADPELWDRCIDPPIPVRLSDLTHVEKQDPCEVAEQLRRGGSEGGNPYVLRQAAELFKRCRDFQAARGCIAEALEIEESYREAGREYESLGRLEDAERSWWRGACWNELSQFYGTNAGFGDQLRRSIVRVETLPGNVEAAVQLIRRVSDALAKGIEPPLHDPQIRAGLAKALQVGLEAIAGHKLTEDAHLVLNVMDHYRSLQAGLPQSVLARALHVMGEYRRVIALLERTGRTKDAMYDEAKAEITEGEDRVEWLQRLKDHRRVVQEYENAKGQKWKKENRLRAASSYVELLRFVEAGRIYLDTESYGEFARVAKAALQLDRDARTREAAQDLVDRCAKTFLDARNWREFESLANELKAVEAGDRQFNKAVEYMRALCRASEWQKAALRVPFNGREIRRTLDRDDRSSFRLNDDQWLNLQCLIAEEVALQADALVKADAQALEPVFKSLLDHVGMQWRKSLTKEVLTGAIERTWLDKDVLPQYEKYLADVDLSADEEAYFRKRWLMVKRRWLNRDHRNLNRKREYDEQLLQWGMRETDIKNAPEYPRVKRAETTTAATRESRYDVNWSTPKCRIQSLVSEEKGKMLIINVAKGEVDDFGGVAYEQGEVIDGVRAFSAQAWGLVDGQIEVGKRVTFSLDGTPHVFSLA